MALTTTTGTLIRQYNAFTGLSAVQRSQSGIARAEIVYYNVNDTWPASTGGNNKLYTTGNIELPKDFGYVITDAYAQVIRPDADGLYPEAVAHLRISPGGVLGPQINMSMPSNSGRQDQAGTTAIGSIPANRYNGNHPFASGDAEITYMLENKPTSLIYPFGSASYTSTPNPSSIWNIQIGENVTNTAAYQISMYVRFLQYDIDQSYNYVIQSPQLTR